MSKEFKSPILLPAGGLKVTGGAKGDLQVGTGSTAYAALAVGGDGRKLFADASQSAGMQWGTSFYGGLMLSPKFRSYQVLSGASGDIDIGAPASGKRWLIQAIYYYNPTGGSITAFPELKRSGTYYKIAASTVLATLTTGLATVNQSLIFESTDTLAINTTASGLTIMVSIVEFSTLSAVKSSVLLSLASGNNTIYTCPASYTACAFAPNGSGVFAYAQNNALNYRNASGGSRNVYFNLVKSGGSVVAPGAGSNAFQEVAAVANGSAFAQTTNSGVFLEAGDFLSVNTNAATSTQIAWANLIEIPV